MELTERQHRDILEHMRRERNWSRRQSQDAVSPNQVHRGTILALLLLRSSLQSLKLTKS